jgi:hypothetical protein
MGTHMAKAITIHDDNYKKRKLFLIRAKRYTITQKQQGSFEYFAIKNITSELSYLFFLGSMGEKLINNWAALSSK